jgi:hypothetical protein
MTMARRARFLAAAGMLAAGVASAAAAAGGPRTIDRRDLCITTGEIEQLAGHRLGIEEPEVRAVVLADTPQAAEIRFTYRGPSAGTKSLASGEVRRQIGLKLRAQDSCNLLYVMWWIEPRNQIAVSIKRNPGQRTHEDCGARGYVNMKARRRASAPRIEPDSTHTLRAELLGRELRVWSDGAPVWEGTLPAEVEDFDGPVGLRSDNVRLELAYRIGGEPGAPISKVPAWLRQRCKARSREAAD